ncbi:MAG: phytoene desaturase family protein, partial [Bdellovibrionaceae bacterium]|nr:phytoene desaturase family protein [Pseudobdellovibrionaceae bacterium]
VYKRQVQTRRGELWECDAVVSNGDVLHTYRDLLGDNPVAQKRARSLSRKGFSMSLFLIYLGVKKQYPDWEHHTVVFGPRYKGLLEDIFKNGRLPEDFSLYVHRPTKTDPSLAPQGCDTFYVLAPVAHLGKLKLDWKAEGPAYADRILKYLDERFLPGLRQNIETMRLFTPQDFQTELNAHLGNAFSFAPTLIQSAYFRPHNKDHKIQGLYFVGAGTHPGAGVPGVVNSGKATASLMLEELRS